MYLMNISSSLLSCHKVRFACLHPFKFKGDLFQSIKFGLEIMEACAAQGLNTEPSPDGGRPTRIPLDFEKEVKLC